MNLLTKLFGSYSKKEFKRIEPLKQAVLALDDKYTKMTDEELKGQTAVLKAVSYTHLDVYKRQGKRHTNNNLCTG